VAPYITQSDDDSDATGATAPSLAAPISVNRGIQTNSEDPTEYPMPAYSFSVLNRRRMLFLLGYVAVAHDATRSDIAGLVCNDV
jgi:hypothetical protein